MKQLLIFLITFLAYATGAQDRYLTNSFDEMKKETFTYATKNGENLDLDIYLPTNDTASARATVIYVHGGGFSGGQRNDKGIDKFCRQLAGYGYVVATISYRLTRKGTPEGLGCDCPAKDKLKAFNAAVEDLQDATFFLIQNREQFGINPYKIILAGSSAGAETILNAGYQPPYCYELNSGPVAYAGLISMAGAIPDTAVIYNESAVPTLFFHGTDDALVPYATAPHHYCKTSKAGYLVLNGAYTIAERLYQLGVPYWLHTTCGGGHEMAGKPMTEYFDVITDFCYHYVVQGEKEFRQTVVEGKEQSPDYETFNFCNLKTEPHE